MKKLKKILRFTLENVESTIRKSKKRLLKSQISEEHKSLLNHGISSSIQFSYC